LKSFKVFLFDPCFPEADSLSIVRALCILLFCFASAIQLRAQDETTLFNGDGAATAYIADDMTIYLWSGKPVAYLYPVRNQDGFDVYGFNGKHLGWFTKGIAWNHDGDAACGVRSVISLPKIEPIKSIKEIKPIKAIREISPIRPIFSRSWSDVPCGIFYSRVPNNDFKDCRRTHIG
jgi:hypothetical protein